MENKYLIGGIIAVVAIAIIWGISLRTSSEDNGPTREDSGQTLKVGYLPLTDHFPIMAAEGADLFEGVNVEPVKFTDWPSLVEALKSGSIDGAHIINSLALKMVSDGYKGKAVVLSHRGDIALSTADEIKDVSELAGKSIAVPSRFSPHFMMLHNYLTKNGIDVENDIDIVDVAPPDFISTMVSKSVAAFIGSEPFPSIAESKNVGHTFKLWDEMQIEGTNGLDCVVVFSDSLIAEKSELVQNYVNSVVKTGMFIEDEPLEAAKAASQFMLNLDPALIVKAVDEPRNRSSYDNLQPVLSEFESFQNYMVQIGLLSQGVDLNNFIETSFAAKAYKNLK